MKLYRKNRTRKHRGGVKPGGKELPTFESTKTKLKEILEKVPPDNKYYEFSQKLNQELNKIKEKKFNEFVNKIYENFDKIMSIPINQKGGAGEEPELCSICLSELPSDDESSGDEKALRCSECSKRASGGKGPGFHRACIGDWGNQCPMCQYNNVFLNPDDSIIRFENPRRFAPNPAGIQINAMAIMQIPLDQMTPEEQADILFIRDQRRRDIVRHDRLVSVRRRILELWGMFLLIFTCHSLGAAWRGQYSSNYLTVIAMFYGSVIVVGLWPEAPGSVSMTDQLTEFLVRILTFLDDAGAYLGGGKKTRRKRYKRKRRTKRKMRKKRGGVKIGDMVKKKYKMDKLDVYGNPTGEKFWKDFNGLVQNIDNKGNTTIYWYADKSTDVFTKSQSKSLTIIPPKQVAIGNMHQADIPQGVPGISYTGDEKVSHLPKEHLTPAIKPEGYVRGIPKPKDDGFAEMMKNPKEQLKKLQSME